MSGSQVHLLGCPPPARGELSPRPWGDYTSRGWDCFPFQGNDQRCSPADTDLWKQVAARWLFFKRVMMYRSVLSSPWCLRFPLGEIFFVCLYPPPFRKEKSDSELDPGLGERTWGVFHRSPRDRQSPGHQPAQLPHCRLQRHILQDAQFQHISKYSAAKHKKVSDNHECLLSTEKLTPSLRLLESLK